MSDRDDVAKAREWLDLSLRMDDGQDNTVANDVGTALVFVLLAIVERLDRLIAAVEESTTP